MKSKLLVLAAVLSFAWPLQAAKYKIDAVHSDVSFSIKHMVVSRVTGNFSKFEGSFEYEPGDPKSWKAEATIDASSIDTNNEKRDEHLRGADFFDVEKYPKITFKSTKVSDVSGDTAKLHGILEMHGIKKEVVLDLIMGGTVKGMGGKMHAGFEASTTIDRQDFGIQYNKVLDSGGLALGNDVKITINIEGIEEK